MSAELLSRRVEKALETCRYLDGRRQSLIERKALIADAISRDDRYVARSREISERLGEAQAVIQQGNKAVFEKLLTTLIREIIPGSEDSVELEYEIRNNRPQLNVKIRTPKGLESIDGKGGSIRQIVSIGLRFIVLTRTTNRRFLAFDEADAWISSERHYMESLASVLHGLAKKAGVQVIYCTHHRPEVFEPHASVARLYRDASGNIACVRSGLSEGDEISGWEGESAVAQWGQGLGLRHVRLINFKAHKDTMVELSSGVNVISGDMDLGKSSIIEALDAVMNNRGAADLIRHGAGAALVEIGLENEMTLRWSYKRSGVKKTHYVLLDEDETVVYESQDGQNAPTWLDECLSMPRIQDFDVHVQRQDQPLFMIGSSTSANARAKLLAIGENGIRMRRLFALHSERLREARRRIRENSAALNEAKNGLAALRGLDRIETGLLSLRQSIAGLAQDVQSLDELTRLATAMADAKRVMEGTREACGADLSDMDLLSLGESLAQEREMERLLRTWSQAQQAMESLRDLPEMTIGEVPEPDDTRDVTLMIDRWENAQRAAGLSDRELAKAREELRAANEALDSAVRDAGGICPTCLSPMSAHAPYGNAATEAKEHE